MKHLDLFSGIGGFALACRMVGGIETIGFSEIDPYASAVLKKHWPDVPNYGDVRTVPTVECDLITGGFPCQPFSIAGKRRGAEDNRFLWPAMLDVIQRCRPTWVIGENVAGLIDMELDRCFADLENSGYEVQPLIIPACAVDAGHRRERVWIIAHAECKGWKRHIKNHSLSSRQVPSYTKSCDGIAKTWEQLAGHRGAIRESDGLSLKMVRDATKSAGNAIVPQVAAEIIRSIMEVQTTISS